VVHDDEVALWFERSHHPVDQPGDATLPPDQAEVILLRVGAGLDGPRVAELVGKRPGAVRVLQHRGLRRLARVAQGTAERGV
jgi:RNA polymerase sigma-70 factor (ECF subfamily)